MAVFLSTPSARRATEDAQDSLLSALFLSTPSARRATLRGRCIRGTCAISIHALREEGDGICSSSYVSVRISIHALREEGDLAMVDKIYHAVVFLSTPSARRATRPKVSRGGIRLYFYPRPPRGGRRRNVTRQPTSDSYFYPRPPRGGRLKDVLRGFAVEIISIHALREEGDPMSFSG